MRDTSARVRLVKDRVRRRKRRREKRVLCGLFTLCLFLFVSLVGAVKAVAGFGQLAAFSVYGSMLLHEGVGGYVLVGLLAFTAAVVLTVLCIRYRERSKGKEEEEETKP